jgi:hypothetical protein
MTAVSFLAENSSIGYRKPPKTFNDDNDTVITAD